MPTTSVALVASPLHCTSYVSSSFFSREPPRYLCLLMMILSLANFNCLIDVHFWNNFDCFAFHRVKFRRVPSCGVISCGHSYLEVSFHFTFSINFVSYGFSFYLNALFAFYVLKFGSCYWKWVCVFFSNTNWPRESTFVCFFWNYSGISGDLKSGFVEMIESCRS